MSQRILLIDYDPRSIGRIRRLLRADGYEVHIAKDGLVGIDAFRRLEPGLTLVQDLLPKRAGEEVCQVLRDLAYGRYDAALVLIVPTCKKRKLQQDAPWYDDVLVSPFDDDTLMSVVRRLAGEVMADPPVRTDTAATSPPIPVELDDVEISSTLDALLGGPQADDPA